jgi:ATP-dependent DNA ligase
VSDPFDALSDDQREALESRSQPEWVDPMLARLTHDPFSDREWVYERKLDGERCLAFRDGNRVRLRSRNKKDLNDSYPELEEALAAQSCDDFIVDGEVVAFEGTEWTGGGKLRHPRYLGLRRDKDPRDVVRE